MHFPSATIRTSHGYSRLPPPPLVPVMLARAELHMLARAIEAEADAARAERQDFLAERLDHRAVDLREAAR